jgi:hypothetical protein
MALVAVEPSRLVSGVALRAGYGSLMGIVDIMLCPFALLIHKDYRPGVNHVPVTFHTGFVFSRLGGFRRPMAVSAFKGILLVLTGYFVLSRRVSQRYNQNKDRDNP